MPPIVVVGNKCDLENERSVSPEEGQDLTKSLGDTAVFIEASAKTNLNVEEVRWYSFLKNLFFTLKVFQQAAKAVIQQRLQDSQKNGKKPGGKCCTIIWFIKILYCCNFVSIKFSMNKYFLWFLV